MKINPSVFLHEDDKKALAALKAIPGFTPLLKAYMKAWSERQFHIRNLSSNLRLGENQMKKYYDMLPPICEKLGIDIPELYVELDVNPNSYTSGDTNPFIVLTSGLLETFPDELIPTVLAHECGHIACHHVLYSTVGRLVLSGAKLLPGLAALVTVPIEIAYAYWMRCSEFSADRAATICDGTPDKMIQACMYFAGYNERMKEKASVDAFMEQAKEYKEDVKRSKFDKTMEFYLYSNYDHPLTAVRAYDCKEWGNSEQFAKTLCYVAGDVSAAEGLDLTSLEIPVAESAKFYIGKNLDDVRDMMIDMGFTSIQTERTTEKTKSIKSGQIVNICINDDSSFKKDTWFPEDSTIVLTYFEEETPEEIAEGHDGKIQIPDGSKKYLGRNYQDVINELGDAGFTEFIPETQTVKKGKADKDGSIVKIAVNGQTQFNKGDWFATDSKIRITYQITEIDKPENNKAGKSK